MAIKQHQLFNTSEIADGNFRSLTEVEKYLEAVKNNLSDLEGLLKGYQAQFARAETAVTERWVNRDAQTPRPAGKKKVDFTDLIEKVNVPKLDVLKKNFSIVEQLSDQVDNLSGLYNNVAVNLKGMRGANETLKNIKAMQKVAESKMQQALKFLNTVGAKYVPTEFEKMVEATITYVAPSLTFRSHETSIYAYQTEEDWLAFSVYIKMNDLEDDEGNVHDKFYIVFTCVLKPAEGDKSKVNAGYYVAVMHNFAPPGKYLIGKHVKTPAEASSMLGILLESENVSTVIGVLPHNLSDKDVPKEKFSVGKRIAAIEVDPHKLRFECVKGVTEQEAQTIRTTLFQELKAVVKIKKARMKASLVKTEGRYVIEFLLTNPSGPGQISMNDIDFLKEHFPQIDDQKIRNVVKIINSD